ncbi:MAG: helix-turn-helix domain-containing protein [Chloroflexi bacterium]|nr:helix-turn-helix domain-containing protein [Chloroflexota bacterium]
MATIGAPGPAAGSTRWISLSQASRLLGVSQATLRHWADQGQVPSFRTPGGHRRFAEEELSALVQTRRPLAPDRSPEQARDKALVRIRRRIHASRGHPSPWYDTLDERGRDRMRLFGRQLVALVLDSGSRSRSRSAPLAEARTIGAAYGREALASGLLLQDLLHAFVFFRASLDEAARALVRRDGMSPTQALDLWQHMYRILDAVLLAAVAIYEPAPGGPPPS